jgi:hypothetical protein
MSAVELELALKKQRLQWTAVQLRGDFSRHAIALTPVFATADNVIEGIHWLRQRPQLVVAGAVALVAARPRRAWRLARRSFFVWQTWSRLQRWLHRQPA